MVIEECWMKVPERNGYDISDQGRICSYRNRQGHPISQPRLMTPTIVNGYLWIKLGRNFQTALHLLVIRTFVGPAPEGMECRHLDGNRRNAKLNNLVYGTKAENYNDRRAHGTHNSGERHGNAKLTDTQVTQMRDSTESVAQLAERYGVSLTTVWAIIRGSTWTHLQSTPVPVPGRLCGDRNNKTKLTVRQVLTIRTSRLSTRELAEQFNVSTTNINAIQKRLTWKHLP